MSPGEEDIVHFSDRRHRLHGHELAPILRAVRSELSRLLEERADLPEAQVLFMVLWRFHENRVGRPTYPEAIDWGLIGTYLEIWTISQGEEGPRQPGPAEEVDP
jgi:hypothetical protein